MLARLASNSFSPATHRAPQDAQKARRRGLSTITIRIERHTGQLTLVISLTMFGTKRAPS